MKQRGYGLERLKKIQNRNTEDMQAEKKKIIKEFRGKGEEGNRAYVLFPFSFIPQFLFFILNG